MPSRLTTCCTAVCDWSSLFLRPRFQRHAAQQHPASVLDVRLRVSASHDWEGKFMLLLSEFPFPKALHRRSAPRSTFFACCEVRNPPTLHIAYCIHFLACEFAYSSIIGRQQYLSNGAVVVLLHARRYQHTSSGHFYAKVRISPAPTLDLYKIPNGTPLGVRRMAVRELMHGNFTALHTLYTHQRQIFMSSSFGTPKQMDERLRSSA